MNELKTTIAAYLAAFLAWVCGLTANELAAYFGIVFAAGTFGINWYTKIKQIRLLESRYRKSPFPSLGIEDD